MIAEIADLNPALSNHLHSFFKQRTKESIMSAQRPRLSIDLTPKQQRFLDSFPFGWRQQIFSVLIDMLIEMTDRCGMNALGVIASKAIKLEEYFNKDLK